MDQPLIRMATLDDAIRLLEIYEPYILNTAVTFEYETVPLNVFQNRMSKIMEQYPWLVYELNGVIVGYAYACPFHERAAFAWDCECSVYVDSTYHGIGIASALYSKLFELIKMQGFYNVYALITTSNVSSIRFHEKWGFKIDGNHERCGYKFGKWYGLTYMSKAIGDYNVPPKKIMKPLL